MTILAQIVIRVVSGVLTALILAAFAKLATKFARNTGMVVATA